MVSPCRKADATTIPVQGMVVNSSDLHFKKMRNEPLVHSNQRHGLCSRSPESFLNLPHHHIATSSSGRRPALNTSCSLATRAALVGTEAPTPPILLSLTAHCQTVRVPGFTPAVTAGRYADEVCRWTRRHRDNASFDHCVVESEQCRRRETDIRSKMLLRLSSR